MSFKNFIRKAALAALTKEDTRAGLFRARVRLGPLRGYTFATPARERLSFALGTYERHVVGELLSHLGPNDVAYDVGANAGYISLAMASECDRVVAFEPDPQNLRALYANIRENGVRNITVREEAVSDKPGKIQFSSYGYSLVGHISRDDEPKDAVRREVPATTLGLVAESERLPKLVKIDVEGAEDAVFRGALDLFERARPVVVAEIRASVWPAIRVSMESIGYRWRTLAGGWDFERDGLADVVFEKKR